MDTSSRVLSTIQTHKMLKGGERVLVACSAGPDSVCMASVLSSLAGTLDITLTLHYVDHGLRPDESPRELALCEALANKLGADFSHSSIDVQAAASGGNLQETARELRYAALEKAAAEAGASRIALGHNLDDQAETFFMRILRGSGPSGLAGIPPVRGPLIRPILGLRRAEIMAYLGDKGLEYATDSSNLKSDYLRNRLRETLMPILEETNPSIVETVGRTTEILADEERYFFIQVTKTLMRLITSKGDDHIELFLIPLDALDRAIARRVLRRAVEETRGLRRITYTHIEDILRLVSHGDAGDSIDLPNNVRAVKKYSTLLITSAPPVTLKTRTMEEPGKLEIPEAGLLLEAQVLEQAPPEPKGGNQVVLDADKVIFPLTVRARQEGDFMYPLGLGHRKKLQDIFVDQKVPRDERNSVPVVASGEQVVWVAGIRGDHRARISDNTTRYLALSVKALL